MEFRLLGPLEASQAGEVIPLGGPKQRTVLTHLLLRANQHVPADRLIDEVWGFEAPDAVRSSLHTYVSHLRKALGAERLERHRAGYVLHVDPADVDALRFEDLVAQGRDAASSDPAAAVRLYDEALSLWRGNVLDDLAQQPSLRPDIARLEALRMTAIEEKIAAELELGRHATLVPELETLTARNPLRERLWAHLMIALYRSGRQGDALAAFRRARTILDEELGILPSPDLQRLQERVLRQEPGLDVSGTPLRGYRLLEQLGAGAFGVVHRAFQPQINREVAIKAVHPDLANDAEFIRRFEVEAQTVARLEHPHIVPLYDYWREPDGAYLVMRLLRGGSLRDRLVGGAVELNSAVKVVEQVSLALAMAHRLGVVHRDVKPANILFDDEGNAYLTDFGIAKDIALAREWAQGRSSDSLSIYLAPEEARGESASARTDIYSLGLVAYEMLSGRRASGRTAGEAGALPPIVAGGARSAVDDVLARATAAEPTERFETAEALAAALRDALTIGPSTKGSAPDRNPYRGLRPFLEADAADYFGREALVDRLIARLGADDPRARFVTVVGASGSGKSSAVRAGLLPQIRSGAIAGSQRWFVVDMVPAHNPFSELLSALRRVAAVPLPPNLADRVLGGARDSIVSAAQWILPDSDSELLLLLDQFEELFTLVEDDGVRTNFVTALAAAAHDPRSRVRVVATLRADFLDRPLAYPELGTLVADGSELVSPLNPEEIERAVVEPAQRAGVTVDTALVAEIVAGVGNQPGALPLLQYAMTELFDHRTGPVLDLSTYREIGGVTGALARRADLIYESLSGTAQDAARQFFLRLVMPGLGTEDTRRRVARAELLSLPYAAAIEECFDAFGAGRLLSFDRDPETRAPTVEVAHEALLREWHRLRSWIDAAREDLRTHRWLHTAAQEWDASGRDESFLITGSRLAQLEEWERDAGLDPTPEERAFIAASVAERDRRAADAAQQEERERALQRRSLTRLRALVAVLAVAVLVAAGLTAYAVDQGEGARSQAVLARAQTRIARARELAALANSNLGVDAERSILLALEAVEATRSVDAGVLPEAEEALHRAVAASRIVATVSGLGGRLDWSPDGRLFVTEGPEGSGRIDLRDAATGKRVRAWSGHEVDVNDVVFSPDGKRLATAGDDGALRVWDVATGDKVAELDGNRQVLAPAFSADGHRVVAAWPEDTNVTHFSDPGAGLVRILDVRSGRLVNELGPHQPGEGAFATALSPNGRHVAIALGDEQAVRIVDASSGRDVTSLEGHTASVADIAWSPDGRWLATSGTDGTARLWDGRTYQPRSSLRGHTAGLVDGDWSAASDRLVTASQDGTAKVWSVTEDGAQELLTLSAHDTTGGLGGAAFSEDGDRVMTGDALISSVRVWDVSSAADAEWAKLPADPEALPSGTAFGEDVIITSPNDGRLAVWDRESYERQVTIDPDFVRTFDIEIDPKGELVAAAGDGGYGVWDLATRQEEFRVPTGGFGDVAWSPDGEVLAAVYQYDFSAVHVLSRAGERIATIKVGPDSKPMAVQFSPDNAFLAIAWWPGDLVKQASPRIEIWDWRASKKVMTLPTHANSAVFDPMGETLLTSGEAGVGSVWDLTSGEALRHLRGHSGPVGDAVFSPDGGRIATAGYDGTVRLWDVDSSAPPVVLRGHTAPVTKVRFSPDGTQLVSTAGDGTARVWAVELDGLIHLAHRKLTRQLTDEECRQFLRNEGCVPGPATPTSP